MIFRPRDKKRRSWKTILWSILSLILFLALFCSSVYFFRVSQKNDLAKKEQEKVVDNFVKATPLIEDADASLLDLKTGTTAGIASRRVVSNEFTHTVKAQLPPIDPAGSFYEGWLVRLVPYDFFPTGEMVTNKEGQFVLEWKGDSETDYSGYTKIVVTLEPRDGNSDPSEHILEGVFGQ